MALEDVPGLVNPIIQAMIATANLQKQGQQQEIEKEKNKQDQKAREEGLRQAEKALEYQHEHNVTTSKISQMIAEAQSKAEAATTLLNYQKYIHAGGNFGDIPTPGQVTGTNPGRNYQEILRNKIAPPEMQTGPAPQGPPLQQDQGMHIPDTIMNALRPQGVSQIASPGFSQAQALESQNAGGYGSVDRANQIAAERERLITRAKGEGGDVEDNRRFAQALALEGQKNEDLKTLKTHESQLVDINKEHSNETRLKIAEIMAGAKLDSKTMDPKVAESLANLQLTGQIKLNPANAAHAKILASIEDRGGNVAFGPKDVQGLKATKELQPIFDNMMTVANQMSKSRIGAFIQGKVQGAIGEAGGSTKLLNDWKIMRGQAILVGRALEGMTGRPLAAQLQADLNSMPEFGFTGPDAVSRIASLKRQAAAAQNTFFEGMPDWQQDMVSKMYLGTTRSMPDFLKIAPQVDKQGNVLDVEESKRRGKAVYEVK